MRHLVLAISAAAAALTAAPQPATASPPGEIASALTISKSSNKNQVHYEVDVDGGCAPAGAEPVHPYWRMLEKSPDATEPLTSREQRAFGLERQDVDGDSVRIVVRGLPARPITIHTWRGQDGGCGSNATTTIEGAQARLSSVYVKVTIFGVSYIQLSGVTSNGAVVSERLSP
jgi:hypothetical protein